jgi:hypothetical protein
MPAATRHGFRQSDVLRELKRCFAVTTTTMAESENVERACYLAAELCLKDDGVGKVAEVVAMEVALHRVSCEALEICAIARYLEDAGSAGLATPACVRDMCAAVAVAMCQPYKAAIEHVGAAYALLQQGAELELDEPLERIVCSFDLPEARHAVRTLVRSVTSGDVRMAAALAMLVMQPGVVGERDVTVTGVSRAMWIDPVSRASLPMDGVAFCLWRIASALAASGPDDVRDYVAALDTLFRCGYRRAQRLSRAVLLVYALGAIGKRRLRHATPSRAIVEAVRVSVPSILADLDDMDEQLDDEQTRARGLKVQDVQEVQDVQDVNDGNQSLAAGKRAPRAPRKSPAARSGSTGTTTARPDVNNMEHLSYLNFFTNRTDAT